ncbi:helix-turn-helix transcriptional regulator [Aestuariivirga sp.]|uniref:helix-turn-helix transcriptional regulator n=1 Tax=Aestuariivirga sp. TaxID=2650926 RepID=UPI003BAB0C75
MKTGLPALIIGLIAVQIICAIVFFVDVLSDMAELGGPNWGLLPEAMASIALFIGIAFEAVYLLQLLRRKASLERSVGMASAAMQSVIDSHFDEWKLTASERDVAALMVKGLSISEIAGVRGSAEGTVKAHLNAIYRKANARNRAEVLSHIMDTLIDKPLLPRPEPESRK